LEGDTGVTDKLVFIHSENAEKLFLLLNLIGTSISEGKGEKPESERWQGTKINEMKNGRIFHPFYWGEYLQDFRNALCQMWIIH